MAELVVEVHDPLATIRWPGYATFWPGYKVTYEIVSPAVNRLDAIRGKLWPCFVK